MHGKYLAQNGSYSFSIRVEISSYKLSICLQNWSYKLSISLQNRWYKLSIRVQNFQPFYKVFAKLLTLKIWR